MVSLRRVWPIRSGCLSGVGRQGVHGTGCGCIPRHLRCGGLQLRGGGSGLAGRRDHKFESRYLDSLVGLYPQEAERYRARSPLFHVDGIDVPVLVLQGSDDPVVPPSQADALVAALRERGVRVEERRYEGEAHGWRRADTIVGALDTELAFFRSI